MSTQQLEAEIRGFFPQPHKAVACLATVDAARHAAPEARPVSLMEADWRFYVATGAGTRKAREMTAHPRAAALVMFRSEKFSGYLRIAGAVERIDAPAERKRVVDAASFELGNHWEGVEDPNLAFFRIVPERIEYMRPGDDEARDVTAELKAAARAG